MTGGRRRALNSWLKRAGQIVLTVAVTWFIVDAVGLDAEALRALDPSALRPRPLVLVGASLLLLGNYALSASIWGRLVVDLGGPKLPRFDAVRLFMIANLGRYVPGKVWQLAGLVVLAKGRGVSGVVATGAAVLGQAIALVAAAAVGMAVLVQTTGPLRPSALAAAAFTALVVVLTLVPRSFRLGIGAWFRLLRAEPPASLQGAHGARWLALYLLNWAGYSLSFWLMVVSFQADAPLVPVATSFAAAYVLGYAMIFAPAGAGVREGLLIAFLTPHLGVAEAGVIAVIARLWTTGLEVLTAGAFWLTYESPPGAGVEPGE